jgi:hypothetical protein
LQQFQVVDLRLAWFSLRRLLSRWVDAEGLSAAQRAVVIFHSEAGVKPDLLMAWIFLPAVAVGAELGG